MEINNSLKKIESHQVPKIKERVRLSDYVPGIFKNVFSKKAIKKEIKKGHITINGDIGYTSDYIFGGETITLYQSLIAKVKPAIHIPLEVVFEDDYLAIVNKPSGILVSGNKKYTLENALPTILRKSTQTDALQRPEPIHRLDYPTSGALLIGKTNKVVIALNKLFEDRKIIKNYYSVTIGTIKDKGYIESPIDNKSSATEYSVVDRLISRKYISLNLVKLIPHTGRRHQLRIHLASIGSPILGDLKYGIDGLTGKGNGLYLHASSLTFLHPINNKEISVLIPLPKKFKKLFPKE